MIHFIIIGFILVFSFPVQAQISVTTWGQGGMRVGTSATTCDAAAEGAFRWNATSKTHEMCDGTAWKGFVSSGNMSILVVTPTSNSNMNISTPGTPAYGSYATFTVQNVGNVTSQAMSVFLSNTGNFEIGTDTCTGNTLAASATCSITVRPKAWGDSSFSGNLSVIADNTAIASLSGTATGSCGTIGGAMGGGVLVACKSGYALIATPGACNDSATPTCPGTPDLLQKTFSSESYYNVAISLTDGRDSNSGNTDVLISRDNAVGATYLAASFCSAMDYGTYTDWYLPARDELHDMYLVKNSVGDFISATYWSSTEAGAGSPTAARHVSFFDGSFQNTTKSTATYIRCVRRH